MSKRFTDTEKWTRNKWFRKLTKDNKLLWFFMLDNCDNIGVWEEDLELAGSSIGCRFDLNEVLDAFKEQVRVFNEGRKWFILDFCRFQYGKLDDSNISNKPHMAFIEQLKTLGLWEVYLESTNRVLIEYRWGIDTPQDKDKDSSVVKHKETSTDRLSYSDNKQDNSNKDNINNKDKTYKLLEYIIIKESEYRKLLNDYGEKPLNDMIYRLNDYIGSVGKKYRSHYHTIRAWFRKDGINPKPPAHGGQDGAVAVQ